MKTDEPFYYQLLLLKLMGFDLAYDESWRGKLLKFWEIFVAICLVIGIITGFHCFFTNLDEVSILTESFQTASNWVMCLLRVIVLNKYREKIKNLIFDLREASITGNKIQIS